MINISGRQISENNPPYVIAEISANHNGSLERAKLSIKMAATSGADAVKIETFHKKGLELTKKILKKKVLNSLPLMIFLLDH